MLGEYVLFNWRYLSIGKATARSAQTKRKRLADSADERSSASDSDDSGTSSRVAHISAAIS